MYIQNVNLDVNAQPDANAKPCLRLSQNENGRVLMIRIIGVDIPEGSTANFAGLKPDGNVYSKAGTVEGNVVSINEDIQMTAVSGAWNAKITVVNDGNNICTARIRVVVDASVVPGDAIPSDSQLDGIVAECQAYAESAKNAAYGSPLTANTAAGMTDQDRVYVYTGSETGYTAGHWYYYDGSAWTDGGVYNAVAVQTDTTLAISGMAADSKKTGDEITALKEDFSELVTVGNLFGLDNVVYNAKLSSGELADNAGTIVSDYIDVSDINQVYFSQKPVYAALYDDTKTFISQATSPSSPWSTTNYGTKASFIRVCIYPDDANVFIVSKTSTLVDKYWLYPTKAISGINVDKQIADYFVANELAKTDFNIDHVVFAGCAGNMTPKYSQGNRHSVYAVNRIGTAIDIRMYGSDSFSVEGLAQVKVSVFIPDATKINSITLQLMGTSYSRPASGSFVDGWNDFVFNTWEGTITNWTTATAIRITAAGSAGIEFYVGKIKFTRPDKANIIVIEDGGYSTFYETAYPMFKTINAPITWALNPGRLNADVGESGHIVTQAEIDAISSDACSEFSFHSWKADPTSSMTVAELQGDTAKCIAYLRQHGLSPEHIWRAAHTQNLASNASSERGMVEALATSTGLATYTVFPFADRWNVPRVQLHGRTSEFYTTMFDTLKKTHCTSVVYTHGVSTYTADITPELLNDFVTKLTAAIDEGWLNPTTYNRLVNDYMTLYD